MDFLQFLGYFLGSMMVWRGICTAAYFLHRAYVVRKFKKKLESGELQMILQKQIFNQGHDDDNGGRTCH